MQSLYHHSMHQKYHRNRFTRISRSMLLMQLLTQLWQMLILRYLSIQQDVSLQVDLTEIQVLQVVRLQLILTVELQDMAVVPSLVRTALRLTVLLHTLQDMLLRILSLRDLLTDVRFSFHMQSVLQDQHLSWLIHLAQESLMKKKSLKSSVRTLI